MKTHTTTQQFNVSPEELFAFLSEIENLPKWATAYALDLKKDGEDYKVTTPQGEMYQIIKANKDTKTIDLYGGPSKEQLWCWPSRVTADNMGGSVFAMTCIQMPDQSVEDFSGQCQTLQKEFENIRKLTAKAL